MSVNTFMSLIPTVTDTYDIKQINFLTGGVMTLVSITVAEWRSWFQVESHTWDSSVYLLECIPFISINHSFWV